MSPPHYNDHSYLVLRGESGSSCSRQEKGSHLRRKAMSLFSFNPISQLKIKFSTFWSFSDMLSEFEFELSPEDLELIERQEVEFVAKTTSACEADDPNTKILHLRAKVEALLAELEHIKREKLAKEGEVNNLRQKLSHYEVEKYELLKKHAGKLKSLEQERQALINHLEHEIEALRFESALQVNRLRMCSGNAPGQRPEENAKNLKSPEFSNTFSDLIPPSGPKKPKASLSRADASCEASLVSPPFGTNGLCGGDDSKRTTCFVDFLHIAIGRADTVFASTEVRDHDRELAMKLRKSIQGTLALTGDALLTLDLEYGVVSRNAKSVLTYYVGLIVEIFICHNLEVMRYLQRPGIKYYVEEHICSRLGREIPQNCALISSLCDYLRRIPPGTCPSLTHQHLRILKHLLWKAERVPDPVLQLISDGTLKQKFLGFVHFPDKSAPFYVRRNDIILDLLQLLDLMVVDKRVPLLLVKQIGDSSILNTINDILCHLILGTAPLMPLLSIPRAFIQLLFSFCLKRRLPAHVIFEPLNLRLLARRLSQMAHQNGDDTLVDMVKSDAIAFFQIFHLIFVLEKVPVIPTLSREFLSLWTAVQCFSKDPDISQYVTDLKPLVTTECNSIIRGDDIS